VREKHVRKRGNRALAEKERLFEPNGKACRPPVGTRRSLCGKKFHRNHRIICGLQTKAMRFVGMVRGSATSINRYTSVSEIKTKERKARGLAGNIATRDHDTRK
jgi:hypothetical protein